MKSWKRLQDAETKQPKGFGFCEYEKAEGVLAAMRLLNNLKLDGQELLLKLNTPTQKYVEEHKLQQEREAKLRQITAAAAKSADGAAEDGKAKEAAEEELSDDSKDTIRLEAIMAIVSERATLGLDGKAAANATDFLTSMQQPAEGSSRLQHRSKPTSRLAEDPAVQLDKQMARERERERREEEQRLQLEDRMFKERLRDWERHERWVQFSVIWLTSCTAADCFWRSNTVDDKCLLRSLDSSWFIQRSCSSISRRIMTTAMGQTILLRVLKMLVSCPRPGDLKSLQLSAKCICQVKRVDCKSTASADCQGSCSVSDASSSLVSICRPFDYTNHVAAHLPCSTVPFIGTALHKDSYAS